MKKNVCSGFSSFFGQTSIAGVQSVVYLLLLHLGSSQEIGTISRGFMEIFLVIIFVWLVYSLSYSGILCIQSDKSKQDRDCCAQNQHGIFTGKITAKNFVDFVVLNVQPKCKAVFCSCDSSANAWEVEEYGGDESYLKLRYGMLTPFYTFTHLHTYKQVSNLKNIQVFAPITGEYFASDTCLDNILG